jgi:hypothetical protein
MKIWKSEPRSLFVCHFLADSVDRRQVAFIFLERFTHSVWWEEEEYDTLVNYQPGTG